MTTADSRSSGTVLVIGAGGPLGLECVKRLLLATQYRVRALMRNPAKHAASLMAVAGEMWHMQQQLPATMRHT
jgi:uncharacterized protein YbjT (DUF2867 family)